MKMICVPLTLEAMRLLDINDCPDSLLETIHLTDEDYKKLLTSGAVETINNTLGKIIDDYEDESINTNEDLIKALAIFKDHLTPENSSVMKKLIHLNTIAIKNHTGLFFFF
jgi:hypothetical protein